MMRQLLAVAVIAMLVAGGCATGDDSTVEEITSTTSTPTTVPASTTTTAAAGATSTMETPSTEVVASSVRVVEDLSYRSGEPEVWFLDVYYSTDREGGPVVVFFHGGGIDRSYPLYRGLAEAMAQEGAVVFVPDWEDVAYGDPDELARTYDGAGCAIPYALAHATEYGGNPETLVLAGHSGGAAPASILSVREPTALADCKVEMAPYDVDRMVLWDGDLMLGGQDWDRYGEEIPDLMEAATLWTWLPDAPRTQTILMTGDQARDQLNRCGVTDPASQFWVRDPDGWFREHLETMGVLDDGCLDIGDAADLLSETMAEYGFDVSHVILEESGHVNLSPEGRTQLVNEITVTNNT